MTTTIAKEPFVQITTTTSKATTTSTPTTTTTTDFDLSEDYEEDPDLLKKKYENMSFDEMSRRMAESNRQISEMLSSTTSMSSSHSTSDKEEEEEEEDENEDVKKNIKSKSEKAKQNDDMDDDNDPNKKWTRLFARAASNGDLAIMKEMLVDSEIRPYININAKDNDGTPPLIYAVCFGKTDVAQVLIEAGAQIDVQDSFGWSALMWATNNNHEALVKILLENGASPQTKSAKGRTVFDFINTDNQKIVDILATNPRDSISSTSSLFYRTTGSVSSSTSSTAADNTDFYYRSTLEGFNNFISEEAELRQKLFESTMALALDDMNNDSNDKDNHDDDDEYSNDERDFDENEFHWDKCSPDQMFVFNSDDLDYILDTVITNWQFPLKNPQNICVPVNVIFLSARFAHYFSSNELLEEVLGESLKRISKSIKSNTRNIHVLAFWITNLTQLLFYLKKDTGLVVATAEQQLNLSELISETYNLIIQDTERRLLKVLGLAILDHESIPGMDEVDFTDDWQRFFRKSIRRSVFIAPDGGIAAQQTTVSPQSVTSILSSTLYVLQSYDVHPIIIIQAMAQFFHFISCEVFNRILTNKKMLCRSKAMQIRMNFSHLEDWISSKRLPSHLLNYFNPTIQLLQLLQCLTQLKDLVDFINTTKKFDALNTAQVKRCVTSYRYEVNEQRIPEEIEKYAMQCAEDIVRHKQRKQSMDKPHVLAMAHHENIDNEYDDDDDEKDMKETRDSKFLLPFSVPTTAHMITFTSNHWDKTNEEHHPRLITPFIPEEWMHKLDKQQSSPVALS
ncbi:MAG: hypothetical protein EXX96DRAFT_520130 [Benjaminiella poitrasii]|nr:MAG: hypothetical protein EXX96DRAFT_520130 [Benjaminiella poitrasii]